MPRQPPRHPRRDTPRTAILAMLLLVSVAIAVAACVAAWGMMWPDTPAGTAAASGSEPVRAAAAAVPALPVIGPVQYLPVSRDDARAINAAKPFSPRPNPPAAPWSLTLPPADTARAVDCLAAAAWYEAGDDAAGEQAVVQVVLNRVRHPAFPKSICGVVFEGSERVTGCQFSFTCDGALRRTPSATAWRRAQAAAQAGMTGLVFSPVGWATHYHTDWVVPTWNGDMEKIAALRTHLFFRWPGALGRASAFAGRHAGNEPLVPALARLSAAHRAATDGTPTPRLEVAAAALADDRLSGAAAAVGSRDDGLDQPDRSGGIHVVAIRPGEFGGTLALTALDLCRPAAGRPCWVVGFAGRPGRVLRGATGRLSWPDRAPDFYYFSDRLRGRETVYWNCQIMPRPNPAQCLPAGFAPEG